MEIFRNGFLFLISFPGMIPIETISRGDEKMLKCRSIRDSLRWFLSRDEIDVRSKDGSTILDMKIRLIGEQLFGITFGYVYFIIIRSCVCHFRFFFSLNLKR